MSSPPPGSQMCAQGPPPCRSSGARRLHSRQSRSLAARPRPRLSWGRRGGCCWLTSSRSRGLLGGETARDLFPTPHTPVVPVASVSPGSVPAAPSLPPPPQLLATPPAPRVPPRRSMPPAPAQCLPAGNLTVISHSGMTQALVLQGWPSACHPPASPPPSHPATQSFLHKQSRWQTLSCH